MLPKANPCRFYKASSSTMYHVTTRNIVGSGCSTSDLSLMKYPCCRPHTLDIFWAGCFRMSRKTIHQNPVDFYSKIVPYLSHHSSSDEGHYLERLWFTIFRDRALSPQKGTLTKSHQSATTRVGHPNRIISLGEVEQWRFKLRHELQIWLGRTINDN